MAELTTTIYDLTVIGAGPGGYEAALEAAKLGLRTALIEKDSLGGTCLNRGCIPTKTLLHSAKLYEEVRDAAQFGISIDHVQADLCGIQEHKQATITTLQKGIAALLKAAKVTVYQGLGTVINTGVLLPFPDCLIMPACCRDLAMFLIHGTRTTNPKNPYTTEGIPARSSVAIFSGR